MFHRNRFIVVLADIIALSRMRIFARHQGGSISVITAITMPVLVGMMGLGAEVTYWYLHQRSMQNAADAAVMAAASNAGTTAYIVEAKAVAGQYGYQDGTGNVTVTATNPASAPGCASNCYSVTVADKVPLFLSQVVGYSGNTAVNGQRGVQLVATAVATGSISRQYCLLALASSGAEGIHTNGAPKANLTGCNIMSNTSATCNGHSLNADVGDAVGTNNGCGVVQNSGVPKVADPYSGLASNIPADTCNSSYPQEPSLPATNKWSGTKSLSGNVTVCGDLQLTGNTTINAPAGAVLVIQNGQLDTGKYSLTTSSGSALTVVFSGTNGGSYQHAPTGGGTLDIAAPTSGPWSGVALYQDPNLTTNVDISAAGNSPTWNITGLVYLPHSSVTFSGAVNKSSNGSACFGMVVDNILINGTGAILNTGGCNAAGLTLPQNMTTRQKLVN